MLPKKEDRVSLRADLPNSLLWSGLPLQPEVDMVLWMERLRIPSTSRIIRAALVKPGLQLPLQSFRDFNLEALGDDYLHLETVGREMVVVGQYVTNIRAFAEPNKIKFLVNVADEELVFVGTTGIVGRWDWLVNPAEQDGAVHTNPIKFDQMTAVA